MTLQLATDLSWPACAAPAQPVPKQVDWQFEVSWADSEAEVREAQRLRYSIFVDQMGARLALSYLAGDGELHPSVEYIATTSLAESMVAILSGKPDPRLPARFARAGDPRRQPARAGAVFAKAGARCA